MEALCSEVVRPSVRSFACPFVRYETCQHDILKTNEPTVMQIGTSGPRWQGHETINFVVRRSKVKVTRGRR